MFHIQETKQTASSDSVALAELENVLNEYKRKFNSNFTALRQAIPSEEIWRFFIDGERQEQGESWIDFENREKGYLYALVNAFDLIFTFDHALTPEFIKMLHKSATENVTNTHYQDRSDGEIRGEFRKKINQETGVSIARKRTTREGLEEICDTCARKITDISIKIVIKKLNSNLSDDDFNNLHIGLRFNPIREVIQYIDKPQNSYGYRLYSSATGKDAFTNEVSRLVSQYEKDMLLAKSPLEKLIIITKFITNCERLHPFIDANCRTFCMLLVNHLLIKNNFPLVILYNPNDFEVRSIYQMVKELIRGMSTTFELISQESLFNLETKKILNLATEKEKKYFHSVRVCEINKRNNKKNQSKNTEEQKNRDTFNKAITDGNEKKALRLANDKTLISSDKSEGSPFFWAVYYGSGPIVGRLLKNIPKNLAELLPYLYVASRRGFTEVIKHLLRVGLDSNSYNIQSDRAPLFFAVENGHLDCVELLLKNKADVSKKAIIVVNGKSQIYSPLQIACIHNDTPIVRLLLKFNLGLENVKSECKFETELGNKAKTVLDLYVKIKQLIEDTVNKKNKKKTQKKTKKRMDLINGLELLVEMLTGKSCIGFMDGNYLSYQKIANLYDQVKSIIPDYSQENFNNKLHSFYLKYKNCYKDLIDVASIKLSQEEVTARYSKLFIEICANNFYKSNHKILTIKDVSQLKKNYPVYNLEMFQLTLMILGSWDSLRDLEEREKDLIYLLCNQFDIKTVKSNLKKYVVDYGFCATQDKLEKILKHVVRPNYSYFITAALDTVGIHVTSEGNCVYYNPFDKEGMKFVGDISSAAKLIFTSNSFNYDPHKESPFTLEIYYHKDTKEEKMIEPEQLFEEIGIKDNTQKYAHGYTGLHVAAKCTHVGSLKYYLNKKADPNIPENLGKTALMFAVERSNTDLIKLLVSYGADLFAKTKKGKTVRDYVKDSTTLDLLHKLSKLSVFSVSSKNCIANTISRDCCRYPAGW